jgi:sugar/nucleoside kinase (ribokinase family)
MGLLVVGSIAYDSIETPFDKIDDALGGSSTYISIAASFFTAPIHLVGIVGSDFKSEHKNLLAEKNIDLDGLEIVENGQTFRWGGKYHYDLNVRDTLFTHLNAFQNFNPIIPTKYRKDKFVVLGNIEPKLQLKVLEQMERPEFVICDTMNLWIETAREDLDKVIAKVDVLIINDSEARLLTKEPNLIRAARMIMSQGPKYLIIKKGEHGALLFNESQIFSAPAYPLESIFDPTGAGDSFAGGFAGFLHQTSDLSFDNIKKAVIFGSTIASYTVEKFSVQRLTEITKLDIKDRFQEFKELSRFDYE